MNSPKLKFGTYWQSNGNELVRAYFSVNRLSDCPQNHNQPFQALWWLGTMAAATLVLNAEQIDLLEFRQQASRISISGRSQSRSKSVSASGNRSVRERDITESR